MAENKADKLTLEELMVSTLAMTDATVKVLIAKGVFTYDEFQNAAQHQTGELSRRAQALWLIEGSLLPTNLE